MAPSSRTSKPYAQRKVLSRQLISSLVRSCNLWKSAVTVEGYVNNGAGRDCHG